MWLTDSFLSQAAFPWQSTRPSQQRALEGRCRSKASRVGVRGFAPASSSQGLSHTSSGRADSSSAEKTRGVCLNHSFTRVKILQMPVLSQPPEP